MLIVNVAGWLTRPESKPPELLLLAAKYVHGSANDDWVTEWAMLTSNAN